MLNYLLFLLYSVGLGYLLNKSKFVKNTGLNTNTIFTLFALKIIAGVLVGFLTQYYSPQGGDYVGNNNEGWIEHQLLLKDPVDFIRNISANHYKDYGNYFGSTKSFWNDLEALALYKLLAVLNFLTVGNYYLNTVFFSTAGFLGHVAFYRLFKKIYPRLTRPVIAGVFLIPSTAYFTATIHKDTLVFLGLGICCFLLHKFATEQFRTKDWFILIISFWFTLLLRNFTALLLLPAAFALISAIRFKIAAWKIYSLIYGTLTIAVCVLASLSPKWNIINIVAQKQSDYFDLGVAHSQISTTKLEPGILNFFRQLPEAVNHSFCRPYLFEFNIFTLNIAAAETIAILIILITGFLLKPTLNRSPLNLFILFFVVPSFILIGLIVPNVGSIMRYRSLFLPLLCTPAMCHIYTRIVNIRN